MGGAAGIIGAIGQAAGPIMQGIGGIIQAGQPAKIAKEQKEAEQTKALASLLGGGQPGQIA